MHTSGKKVCAYYEQKFFECKVTFASIKEVLVPTIKKAVEFALNHQGSDCVLSNQEVQS